MLIKRLAVQHLLVHFPCLQLRNQTLSIQLHKLSTDLLQMISRILRVEVHCQTLLQLVLLALLVQLALLKLLAEGIGLHVSKHTTSRRQQVLLCCFLLHVSRKPCLQLRLLALLIQAALLQHLAEGIGLHVSILLTKNLENLRVVSGLGGLAFSSTVALYCCGKALHQLCFLTVVTQPASLQLFAKVRSLHLGVLGPHGQHVLQRSFFCCIFRCDLCSLGLVYLRHLVAICYGLYEALNELFFGPASLEIHLLERFFQVALAHVVVLLPIRFFRTRTTRHFLFQCCGEALQKLCLLPFET